MRYTSCLSQVTLVCMQRTTVWDDIVSIPVSLVARPRRGSHGESSLACRIAIERGPLDLLDQVGDRNPPRAAFGAIEHRAAAENA
jgi:hypothetical protein